MAVSVARPTHRSETRSTSPGNVVWTIALRELAEQVRSLRFLLIVGLVLVLTPLSVYVGTRDYKGRLENANQLAAEQALIAGQSREENRGMDIAWTIPWTTGGELAALRSVRPPEVLSVLVHGLDGAMPEYWDYSPTGLIAGPSAWQPQRLADMLGQLDFEFLIRVALGLLAILLAFDAVAGEKELGTLRALLSQPVSRAALLTGKLVGSVFTLLVPLGSAFLIALLSAQMLGIDLLQPGNPAKIGLLALTSAAYLLCFLALGLLVSSTARTQKTSLVVLLVLWVLAVLAVPPMASLIGKTVYPTIPSHVLQDRKHALDDDVRRQAEQAMGVVYREITGAPEGWADSTKYEANKEVIDRRIAPIRIGYLNKRRQLMGEIDRDAERRSGLQNDLTRVIMAVSPAAAFAGAAADLAGTGDAQRSAWLDAANRQQISLNSILFDDPPSVMINNKGAQFRASLHKAPTAAELPRFVPPNRNVAANAERALFSLGLLFSVTAIFIAAGFIAFSRYDVR